MAQLNDKFTAFWMNTTTAPWTPLTGLSATINIRDTSGTLLVNNQVMTELWWGWYIYSFTAYNAAVDYLYDCNPGATAYRESGVTTNIQQLISEVRGSGGGMFSSQTIISSIWNSEKRIIKKIEDEGGLTRTDIDTKNNETNSHIEVAKGKIITTIDSIEQPEVDTSDIVRWIGVLKAQNTKLSSYLKWEDDKEKADIAKNHKKMMDDMEECYKQMEKENKIIIGDKEKDKEEVMKDADEIIESLESEIKIVWENAIKEIKTLLK